MVTIFAAHKRESKTGNIHGIGNFMENVMLIQSSKTGRFYATAKRCFISSTFDEATAGAIVGTKLSGSIEKVECDPYDYTVPETGEVVELSHTYTYVPAGGTPTQPLPATAEII